MRKTNWFGLLFLVWIGSISTLSLISFDFDDGPDIDIPFSDKGYHFIFHCISMVLGGLAARHQFSINYGSKKVLKILLLALFCYGLLIEGLQAILPTGRSAEIGDVLANTLGLFAGIFFLKLLFKKTSLLKWED